MKVELETTGWTLAADEDGTVELFHESSSLPVLSHIRELSEVLEFIAVQPTVKPQPIGHEFYMASGFGGRTALTCSCRGFEATFFGQVSHASIDAKVAEHRAEVSDES